MAIGLGVFAVLLAAPALADYALVTQWGEPGSGAGQFNYPKGVAADPSGNVYVADSNNNRVQRFTPDGQFLLSFGSPGSANGQFNGPAGIAVDGAGNVFVVDAGHYIVQEFTADGSFIRTFGSLASSSPPGPGEFDSNPEDIAVHGSGDSASVYVTDQHRVLQFTGDGTFVRAWGGDGSGDGQISAANGVAVDGAGNVYVTDGNNARVQRFAADGSFVGKWGTPGSADGQFLAPQGVAVRSDGHVFVGDDNRRDIQEFTADGGFVGVTDSIGPNSGAADKFRPYGLALDTAGDLYLTDIQPNVGNRVLKLREAGPAPPPPPPPVVGESVNVAVENGIVRIKLPPGTSAGRAKALGLRGAQAGFVRLTAGAQIPVGSLVDTKKGRVGMTSAAGTAGGLQKGSFSRGLFKVIQRRALRAFTELRMTERLSCGRGGSASAARRRSRRLFGNAAGRFRTRGRHSAATVRGTIWLTKDTCTTTTTIVRRGSVRVRDFRLRKNVMVKQGRRYVARARRRARR